MCKGLQIYSIGVLYLLVCFSVSPWFLHFLFKLNFSHYCSDINPVIWLEIILLPLQPADELQFVWCEVLSQALAAIWSSSVATDPNPWLKWDPQRLKDQPVFKKHHGIDIRVLIFHVCCWCQSTGSWFDVCWWCFQGPAILSKAAWSRCVLGVLSSSESVGRWAPSGEALLSHSYITLGEWKDRIQQLQDLSAVLWDNMGMPTLAEFRYSKALFTQLHCLFLDRCKSCFCCQIHQHNISAGN